MPIPYANRLYALRRRNCLPTPSPESFDSSAPPSPDHPTLINPDPTFPETQLPPPLHPDSTLPGPNLSAILPDPTLEFPTPMNLEPSLLKIVLPTPTNPSSSPPSAVPSPPRDSSPPPKPKPIGIASRTRTHQQIPTIPSADAHSMPIAAAPQGEFVVPPGTFKRHKKKKQTSSSKWLWFSFGMPSEH
ncbi:vegetative cell wall protein gp1-like [Humulus lupulus]|uniref:vegetative cell wall protein gp1-like n=1 Tax=Humulus lupulus TaxID=3486 RepID=UPI002B40F001|nr:vegetative cell wall protein gp1-like [Humulus lupulus]